MSEAMSAGCAERNDLTSVRVAWLAGRQQGVMKDRQLHACGLSRFAIRRWVAAQRLHPLLPGVYAVGHDSVSARGRLVAALFYGGEGAALSHRSGAAWWGTTEVDRDLIHISVATRRRSVAGIVVHHPRRLERVFLRGLPVTPLARTLLEFAAGASCEEVRKALAEADYRGLLVPRTLEAVMGRGRPGSATLRAAWAKHLPELAKTASPLEEEFLRVCERAALPIPEPNQWIGRYRVDALFRDARVIVKLDGKAAHSSAARRLTDHERDMKLRSLGYTVRRYSWHQVFGAPNTVVIDLQRSGVS